MKPSVQAGKKRTLVPPESFRKYFWDCEFRDLSLKAFPEFTVERLLQFGDEDAVRWVRRRMKPAKILGITRRSRTLDAKTKNYWDLMLGRRSV